MPPIKLTEDERLYRNFWGNIEKKRVLYGITMPELAISAKISQATIYNRKKGPETLTLKEMQAIAKKLHTSVAKLLED